jgi:hypothetical protein
MITKFIRSNGKVWDALNHVPEDIDIVETSDAYYVRFNHEIMVEVSKDIYAVLEQHIDISNAVAEANESKKENHH